MIAMILTSFSANSQVNLTDEQARRALEKIDSLDICIDEVQSVRAENELYVRHLNLSKNENISLRSAIREWEHSAENYKQANEAVTKALNRQQARTLIWQIATPAALIVGYLIAK